MWVEQEVVIQSRQGDPSKACVTNNATFTINIFLLPITLCEGLERLMNKLESNMFINLCAKEDTKIVVHP